MGRASKLRHNRLTLTKVSLRAFPNAEEEALPGLPTVVWIHVVLMGQRAALDTFLPTTETPLVVLKSGWGDGSMLPSVMPWLRTGMNCGRCRKMENN